MDKTTGASLVGGAKGTAMEAEDETQLPIEVEEIHEDAEVQVSTTETQNQNPVGEASVGWRVKVYWPKMKKWYYGQVLLFDANEKTHTVFYDDWQLTDETSETKMKWCGPPGSWPEEHGYPKNMKNSIEKQRDCVLSELSAEGFRIKSHLFQNRVEEYMEGPSSPSEDPPPPESAPTATSKQKGKRARSSLPEELREQRKAFQLKWNAEIEKRKEETDQKHLCLPTGTYLRTTIGKRKSHSAIWEYVKCLTTEDSEGFTHVCIYPLGVGEDGKQRFCNYKIKLHKNKLTGSWINSIAKSHVETVHPESTPGTMAKRAKEAIQSKKEEIMQNSTFMLSVKDAALASQARYYVYSTCAVSKNTFECEFFVAMLRQHGHNSKLSRKNLANWVRAEFEVFRKFLRFFIELKWKESRGNIFCQIQHDGATIANKKKYEAVGLQACGVGLKNNVVLCLGFKFSVLHDAKTVAELVSNLVFDMTGRPIEDLCGSVIADGAAQAVGTHLDIDSEICNMHDADKLGRSSIGTLVRTKSKQKVNPFDEGQEYLKRAHAVGVHFSYGTRYNSLVKYAKIYDVAPVRIKVDLCGTRVAAQHNLFKSLLRMKKPLDVYMLSELHEDALPILSTQDWKTFADIEAVLNITSLCTTLSQSESYMSGAYKVVLRQTVLAELQKSTIEVIDWDAKVKKGEVARMTKNVASMTRVGKECLQRALDEGRRRWCDKSTGELKLSDREMCCLLLDVRVLPGIQGIFSRETASKAKLILKKEYIAFKVKAETFKYTKPAFSITDARESDTEFDVCDADKPEETPGKVPEHSATGYWSDEEKLMAAELHLDPPQVVEDKIEAFGKEFDEAFCHWRLVKIDWQKEFPDVVTSATPDILKDLFGLNLSKVYASLTAKNKYGILPLMASVGLGQLGSLMSESFCERIVSMANQVMTEGRTLLSDEELEMLVVLRMNSKFMKENREMENARRVSGQPLNMTLVQDM